MKLARMTVLTAWRALRRNLTRSILTMLGVVIGVAAVIAMVSVGQGADASVQAQIASMGTNSRMVSRSPPRLGFRSGWGGVSPLTVATHARSRRNALRSPGVSWIKRELGPVSSTAARNGRRPPVCPAPFPAVRRLARWRAAACFTQSEEDTASQVVVLGQRCSRSCSRRARTIHATSAEGRSLRSSGCSPRRAYVVGPGPGRRPRPAPSNTAERRARQTDPGPVNMILVSNASPAGQTPPRRDARLLARAPSQPPWRGRRLHLPQHGPKMLDLGMRIPVMATLLAAARAGSLLVGVLGGHELRLVSSRRTRESGVGWRWGSKSRHHPPPVPVEAGSWSAVGG